MMAASSGAMLDVLLVGYGAVGIMCTCVHTSEPKRVRVTVVARGNFHVARDHGVSITSGLLGTHSGWRPYRTLSTVREAADHEYAYVVVTTKALPDIMPTSDLLSPFLTPSYTYSQPTYVLLQNGMGVEEDLYAACKVQHNGEPSIISAAVFLDADLTEARDGVRQMTLEKVQLGLYKPNNVTTADSVANLRQFFELLRDGGSNVSVSENVQYEKFMKNRWNAAVATCCSLVRYPPPALSATPRLESIMRPVLHAIITEIGDLGVALGYPVTAADADYLTERTLVGFSKTTTHRPSMLIDVERGSPLEIEVIVGTLIRWGHEKGIDMPRLQTIYALLSVVQAQLLQQ